MVSRNLIDQAGKLLAEAAGADSTVVLFGSHARGEARADSDVDFLVIEPVVENRNKEWERLRRALRPRSVSNARTAPQTVSIPQGKQ